MRSTTSGFAHAALVCALGLAGACAAGQDAAAQARSAASVTDIRVEDPVLMKQRAELLAGAEAALARGDTEAALATFERAAGMLHAPDTEMGIVRSQMQAGQYRRALAFAAHTAGAHLEAPAASALYAWLLHVGGQESYAKRVLDAALQRSGGGDASVLREAQAALAFTTTSATIASGRLLGVPHRMAPYPLWPGHAAPGDGAALRVAASGVLLDGARLALVPSRGVANARRVWIRNGLGRTAAATPVATDAAMPFMLLRLESPLAGRGASSAPNEDPTSFALAPRDPFAGSPGFAIDFAAGADATPQWPWLHAGFFGSVEGGTSPQRRLGIATRSDGAGNGAVVFDAAGRWAGLALPPQEPGGEARWWPVSALRQRLGTAWPASLGGPQDAVVAPAAAKLGADEVYERGLTSVVQVLVEP